MIETFTATEKLRARQRCVYARRTGKLVRQPCEACGAEKTEAHHDDYSKPLDVRWLCRSCHLTEHSGVRCAWGGGRQREEHCARGHSMTGHNVMMHRRGKGQRPKRKCRACHNLKTNERRKNQGASK